MTHPRARTCLGVKRGEGGRRSPLCRPRGGRPGPTENFAGPCLVRRGDDHRGQKWLREGAVGCARRGHRAFPGTCHLRHSRNDLATTMRGGASSGPYVSENPDDSHVRGHSQRAYVAGVATPSEDRQGGIGVPDFNRTACTIQQVCHGFLISCVPSIVFAMRLHIYNISICHSNPHSPA